MVEVRHAVFGILIVGLHFAAGQSLTVYHSVGEDASLLCTNVISQDCSSTTWIYNKININNKNSPAIEEVAHGVVKIDSPRKDRLSLTSNCSLTVHNVSTEDAGRYICQQYLKKDDPKKGEDALVQLSVLTMSTFTPETHLEPDGQVVLSCSLYTYDACQSSSILNWVDETGRVLTKTSLCNPTLTMTVQKEDINRRFRCQVIDDGGKVETFIDVTPKFPDNFLSNPSLTVALAVAGAIGAAAVVCFLPVVIICKKIAKRQKPIGDNIEGPDEGISYATINYSCQKTSPKADTQQEDTATDASVNYSSSRGSEPLSLSLNVDYSNLYATVTKPQGRKST